MRHVPHVFVPAPWETEELALNSSQREHLGRVLRLQPGAAVSYTDGDGMLGTGVYESGIVVRGEETKMLRPTDLCVAAAVPAGKERARFMVEKLAELGIAQLMWMTTRHGEGRIPSAKKSMAWSVSALEQSRGAWLMVVGQDPVDWDALEPPIAAADPGGVAPERLPDLRPRTVVIGPEGGWAPEEIPESVVRIDLGPTILRVETAAIVAATRLR